MRISLKFLFLLISLGTGVNGVAKQPNSFINIDGNNISSEHIDAEMQNIEPQLKGLSKKEKSKTMRALRKETLKQIIERKSMTSFLKYSPKTQKNYVTKLNKCIDDSLSLIHISEPTRPY